MAWTVARCRADQHISKGLDACVGQHLHKNGKRRALAAHAYPLTVHFLAHFVAPRSPASTSVMAMHTCKQDTPREHSMAYAGVIWLLYAADGGSS